MNTEETLRALVEGREVTPPRIALVIARGRQLRRRRRALIVGAAAAMAVGLTAVVWPISDATPARVIAADPGFTVGPSAASCMVVGRQAGPQTAEGLRLLPATPPDGTRLDLARASEGTACLRAAAPLVMVRYGRDLSMIDQTFVVWGPGADGLGLGDPVGRTRLRGHDAQRYPGPAPLSGALGRTSGALLWSEEGLQWLAVGENMEPGELHRLAEQLRITPATGQVDLPADARAGFTVIGPVPADDGDDWRPVWTALYRGPRSGQVSITVTRSPFDTMLHAGMRVTTLRGRRVAYVLAPASQPATASLVWEIRPGVLVHIEANRLPVTTAGLLRIADSLQPVAADDPRITD